MSSKDLFGVDLPSEDESEDEDYVTENEGSSSDGGVVDDETRKNQSSIGGYKRHIQKQRIQTIYENLKNQTLEKSQQVHSEYCVDPLMLLFQQRVVREKVLPTTESVALELSKYLGTATTGQSAKSTLSQYKQQARSEQLQSSSSASIAALASEARSGISRSLVEVEEEVRFAGEVIKIRKSVEKTSSLATKFEKRKLADQTKTQSLGSFQTYLNQVASKRAVTSVEKSASDWNRVKMVQEGLDESLKAGSQGYIAKQSFLARSDAKQDDLRRDARRKRLMEQV